MSKPSSDVSSIVALFIAALVVGALLGIAWIGRDHRPVRFDPVVPYCRGAVDMGRAGGMIEGLPEGLVELCIAAKGAVVPGGLGPSD